MSNETAPKFDLSASVHMDETSRIEVADLVTCGRTNPYIQLGGIGYPSVTIHTTHNGLIKLRDALDAHIRATAAAARQAA